MEGRAPRPCPACKALVIRDTSLLRGGPPITLHHLPAVRAVVATCQGMLLLHLIVQQHHALGVGSIPFRLRWLSALPHPLTSPTQPALHGSLMLRIRFGTGKGFGRYVAYLSPCARKAKVSTFGLITGRMRFVLASCNFGARSSPSRWGSSVAGAASNVISGAGTAISGALSPTHSGRGSEHMLGHQVLFATSVNQARCTLRYLTPGVRCKASNIDLAVLSGADCMHFPSCLGIFESEPGDMAMQFCEHQLSRQLCPMVGYHMPCTPFDSSMARNTGCRKGGHRGCGCTELAFTESHTAEASP